MAAERMEIRVSPGGDGLTTLLLSREERDVLRTGAIYLTGGNSTVGDYMEESPMQSEAEVLKGRAMGADTRLAVALLDDLGWQRDADQEEFEVTVPAEQVEELLIYLLHCHGQGICDEIWQVMGGTPTDGPIKDVLDAGTLPDRERLVASAYEWHALDELLSKVRGGDGLRTPGDVEALKQAAVA